MKAFVIVEPGVCRFEERPEPELLPGQALVRVRQIGLCGSDLKTLKGENPMVSYPRIIGHEVAAEIVEAPRGAPSLRPGALVSVYPYSGCGSCSACRRGRSNCCRRNRTMGVAQDGAARPLLGVAADALVDAEGLTVDEAAVVEPLSVGYHAVGRGRVEAGQTVVVLGCGMIGLGAVAAASAAGARVIAVDVEEGKLERARGMGAAAGVNSAARDPVQAVADETGGEGADVVIEAVGVPSTYRLAVDLACNAGCVVYIGYAADEVSFETRLFVSKELDIRGSRNALPRDFAGVTAMLRQKRIDVTPLVSRRYPFADIERALRDWAADPSSITKIVIDRFDE